MSNKNILQESKFTNLNFYFHTSCMDHSKNSKDVQAQKNMLVLEAVNS